MPQKNILLYILFICFGNIYAQDNISTTGGNTVGSGSVSYSVGQILTSSLTGGNYSLAPGVQQAFEISIVLSSPDFNKST